MFLISLNEPIHPVNPLDIVNLEDTENTFVAHPKRYSTSFFLSLGVRRIHVQEVQLWISRVNEEHGNLVIFDFLVQIHIRVRQGTLGWFNDNQQPCY